MIFYFSGTGNTRWVAERICRLLDDRLYSIADWYTDMQTQDIQPVFTFEPDEQIGFIFPVYSWGPPAIVLSFIEKMKWNGYNGNYTYFVCTCGDDIGLTGSVFRQSLKQKGYPLHAGFSIFMPNTYVALPGFNIDDPAVSRHKVDQTRGRLQSIAEIIKKRMNRSPRARDMLYGIAAPVAVGLVFLFGFFGPKEMSGSILGLTSIVASVILCLPFLPVIFNFHEALWGRFSVYFMTTFLKSAQNELRIYKENAALTSRIGEENLKKAENSIQNIRQSVIDELKNKGYQDSDFEGLSDEDIFQNIAEDDSYIPYQRKCKRMQEMKEKEFSNDENCNEEKHDETKGETK